MPTSSPSTWRAGAPQNNYGAGWAALTHGPCSLISLRGAGRRFLHSTPTLSKKVLGDYLGHKNNEPVLRAFVRQFDFGGRRIDEALRMMLESFRLPGESQMIERVMSSFAAVYMTTAPPEIKHEDAAFVLSYSIVMLNTDQVRDARAGARAENRNPRAAALAVPNATEIPFPARR